MIGTKTISDLITDSSVLKTGCINIIEAPVSSGKTHFALNTLPMWAGTPEKVLYLIDTTNGELRLQRNILTVSHQTYTFSDYCSGKIWGEGAHDADGKMPVMTYAGFGSEVIHGRHFDWHSFDYIICDEMQNLVNYQNFKGKKECLIAAENALRDILRESTSKIICLSATPQKIRERFGILCHEVPFDRKELRQLETFEMIPYIGKIENILAQHIGQTGILYISNVTDMIHYIDYANSIGLSANGFWSPSDTTQAKYAMTKDQWTLQNTILQDETFPSNLNLLVINAASETCIKINGEKRKVDYMIVHNKNEEVCVQVRGRYHGDLQKFYYHNVEDWNNLACRNIPNQFLNTRLYKADRDNLCDILDLRKPDDPNAYHYMWPTVMKYLLKNGYEVIGPIKDKKRNGQNYYVISEKGTNLGAVL